jgi:hypothetical protein
MKHHKKLILVAIISVIVVILVIAIILYKKYTYEYYGEETNAKGYLTPSRDLYCEKRGLSKSVGPQLCCVDGKNCINTKNCRCSSYSTGLCKICHKKTKKKIKNEIIHN